MRRIETIGTAVLLAALAVWPSVGHTAANRMTEAGIVTVIGTRDAGMCVKSTDANDLSEAMYWCTRAIRRGETSTDERAVAFMHRGVVYLKRGELERARKDLDEAIRLTPHYGDAHFNKGNVLFQQGRMDDAIAAYGTALANNPSTPEVVHYNRSRAYAHLGQTEREKADLERAQALMTPDSPLAGRLSSLQ